MILVDPGHGLFLTKEEVWTFQRDEYWGVIEDTTTPILSQYLVDALEGRGHKVRSTRPYPNTVPGDELGLSGHPRWKEASLYWLRSVLDGHPQYYETGNTDRARDINCRPLYANFLKPELALSIHVDASRKNPDASGVSVWHRNECGESKALAHRIYTEIVKNSDYDGGRGVKGNDPLFDAGHVKSRAWFKRMDPNIPAVIVEFLFYTNRMDNLLLQERSVLIEAAKAIAYGIDIFLREVQK